MSWVSVETTPARAGPRATPRGEGRSQTVRRLIPLWHAGAESARLAAAAALWAATRISASLRSGGIWPVGGAGGLDAQLTAGALTTAETDRKLLPEFIFPLFAGDPSQLPSRLLARGEWLGWGESGHKAWQECLADGRWCAGDRMLILGLAGCDQLRSQPIKVVTIFSHGR